MFVDRFIPPEMTTDIEERHRARLLIALLAGYILFLVGSFVFLQTFAYIHDRAGEVSSTRLFPVLFGFWFAIVWILKRYKAYRLCSQLMISCIVIGDSVGLFITGGPMSSAVLGVSLVPILLAFVLLDTRAGLAWTAITAFIHISLLAMSSVSTITFPSVVEGGNREVYHGMIWVVAYTAIAGIMAVVGFTNRAYRQALAEERERIDFLAAHDSLTGLVNRHHFTERLQEVLARANRNQTLLALFYLDLDGFKEVNDHLGHDAGDTVLKTMADRLTNNLRTGDTVARMGGDEFVMILEGIKDPTAVEGIGEKLCRALAAPIDDVDDAYPISASIGIALYPNHSVDTVELVKMADTAMYLSKRVKNSYTVYEPKADEGAGPSAEITRLDRSKNGDK